ncbi:MAG: DUF6977 family protein [Kiritimatiellia bacterium]
MAIRPVFVPLSGAIGVETIEIEFKWTPGLAVSQTQKNIRALHEAFLARYPGRRLLEASTKAPERLGKQLSPFLLGTMNRKGVFCCVESVFQACKVFQDGAGPFPELFSEDPRTVRHTVKAHEPSPLKEFRYGAHAWPLEPTRLFYDYLYCSALKKNPDLARQISSYDCFTDISCNPKKSLNCQAYAIALYRSLEINGKLEEALKGKDAFLRYHPKDTVFLSLERGALSAARHLGNGLIDAREVDRICSEMSRLRGAVQDARTHEVAQSLENEKLRDENQELSSLADEAALKIRALEEQADKYGKEKRELIDAHKREVYQLRSEKCALEKRSQTSAAPKGPRKNINSFDELRQYAETGAFNHCAFSEEAWKQVPKSKGSTLPGQALEMLIDLNEVLWPILFEQSGADVEKAFKEKSPFEYAHGEGKQTKKDSTLAAQRHFRFEGQDWEMWPHIKYGTKKGKLLRIHFAIDNEAKRLIVGFIGEHMDNYTTKKMK